VRQITGEFKYFTRINDLPIDGRLVAVASFSQSEGTLGSLEKLPFFRGEAVIIISASVDNTYWLFGFKETQETLKRQVEQVEVFSFESTTVIP